MTTPSPLPEAPEASGRLFLVWSPGGLVEGAEARLETALPNANATTLVTGLAWLSDTSAGHSPPRGFLFPIDLAYVEPTEYGRVTAQRSCSCGPTRPAGRCAARRDPYLNDR